MTENATTTRSLAELKGRKGRTRPDAPDGPELGEDFWNHAEIVTPRTKQSVHLRVDADVLDFFKRQGKGHLTRMNAVLRSYYESRKDEAG